MNVEYFTQLQSVKHPLEGATDVYPASETVPGMDMKPAEIIERCVRHLPVPISYRETFVIQGNPSDDELLDYTPAADEFEVMDRQRELLADIERKQKEARKAKNKPPEPPKPPENTPAPSVSETSQ